MDKRKVIIFTIISTIISIIFILCSYFGFVRYFNLYINSSNKYVENYSKLHKVSENRVVISLSTTPDKIDKIKPMLNSILDQTVKVDQIALVIPDKYKGKKYNIPKYINNICNIFPAGKNYGKGTKLIPILLREKECGTTIIALDDNIIYGQDFIYTMLEESKKNPGKVLIDQKGVAILVKPEYFGCDVIDRDKDKFDNDWFLDRAKDSKVIRYIENYSILGI